MSPPANKQLLVRSFLYVTSDYNLIFEVVQYRIDYYLIPSAPLPNSSSY